MNKSYFRLSPLISITLVFVISLLFLKPKIEEILLQRTEIETQKIKIERLTQKENLLKQLSADDLKTKIQLMVEAVPSEKDVPSFLAALDFLAKEASVSVVAVQTTPGKISTPSAAANTKEADKVQSVPLNITLEGQMGGVKAFLSKMLSSLPLQSVQSFSFNFEWNKKGQPENKEPFGKVVSNFALGYYFQYLPKEIGKVTDMLPKISAADEKTLSQLQGYEHLPTVTSFTLTGRDDPFSPL